jgi:transcriptional/translational regulatory protein YebC/TACO1
VITKSETLEAVQNALAKNGKKVSSAQSNLVPLSTVEITSKDTAKLLLKLLDNLENHDDVQNVFANFEMDQDWMSEYLN